jgi:uncharacterized protein
MPTAAETGPQSRPRGGLAPLFLAALVGLAAGDALRPPAGQAGAWLAISAIDGYRATVSPLFARTRIIQCRFTPTCSAYGREAVARFGWPRGSALAAARILRCHPFGGSGADPVPLK